MFGANSIQEIAPTRWYRQLGTGIHKMSSSDPFRPSSAALRGEPVIIVSFACHDPGLIACGLIFVVLNYLAELHAAPGLSTWRPFRIFCMWMIPNLFLLSLWSIVGGPAFGDRGLVGVVNRASLSTAASIAGYGAIAGVALRLTGICGDALWNKSTKHGDHAPRATGQTHRD
jgi:hypothetical protein